MVGILVPRRRSLVSTAALLLMMVSFGHPRASAIHQSENHACFTDYAGYWLAARDAGVFGFGSAGPRPGTNPPSDVVGLARLSTLTASTPAVALARSNGEIILRAADRTDRVRASGARNVVGVDTVFGLTDEWWIVNGAGAVYTSKESLNYGSMAGRQLSQPVVGIAVNADASGYWLVSADGGVFAFGSATFHGSMGGTRLNAPIVGITDTPSGHGYWLVASDGGIFAFGDAQFHGSTGGTRLNQPVAGMAAQSSEGYWLVATDGGVFAFGTARFFGSLGGSRLQQPIVGIAASPGNSSVCQ